MKSEANFGFRLEGENTIDAEVLAKMIYDVSQLTKAAAKDENPEAYIKINVTAFKNGSFETAFSTICEVAQQSMPYIASSLTLASTVVGIVKGYLEIKKHLKGNKPQKIIDNNDQSIDVVNNEGQTITVSRSSGAVINNTYIDKLVVDLSTYSQEHNPNGGFTFSTAEGNFSCNSEDIKHMSKSFPIMEESLCKRQKFEADLAIKKPDFTGRSDWGLKYQGKVIFVSIEDEEFIKKIHSGDLSIHAGDYITALLEICVDLDKNQKPKDGTEKYTVLKVIGGIKNPKKMQMKIEDLMD